MRVTVFGSATAPEGGALHAAALDLGRRIGGARWTLCTGGYDGTMAAASRGAHEVGGHVVGVTLEPWARFGLRANGWVGEEIVTTGLLARLGRLLESDAFVALHGGIGTLTEVTLTWQLLQAWELPPAPLVLVGPQWRALVGAFAEELVLRRGDLELLALVDTPREAVEILAAFDPAGAKAERDAIRAKLLAEHGLVRG